jgi:hypothetical protein
MKLSNARLAVTACVVLAGTLGRAQDATHSAGLAATNGIGPRIEFVEPVYDWGKVVSGKVVSHDYVFKNTGDEALEVSSIIGGCHCTTAGDWTRHVEPGQTGTLTINFDSKGFSGMIARTPTVMSNDRRNPRATIQLKGLVWVPFQLSPATTVFNLTADTEPDPVALSNLELNSPKFTAEVVETRPGREFRVYVRTVPPEPPGVTQATITLKTTSTNMAELDIPVMAIVSRPAPPPRPLTNSTNAPRPTTITQLPPGWRPGMPVQGLPILTNQPQPAVRQP